MQAIITSVISIVMTAVSGYLVWVAQQRYKSSEKTEAALKVLLRRELRELHGAYMKAGQITAEELAEYNEIYQIYHDHHGNGSGTIWHEDVNKLRRV